MWYVFICCVLILASATLVPVLVRIRSGLNASASGLSDFTGACSSASNVLVGSAVPPTQSAITTGRALMSLLGGAPEAQAVLDDVGLLFQQLWAGSAAVTAMSAAATAILNRQWPFGRLALSVLNAGEAAWIACASALAAIVAFSLLSLSGLRATKCSVRSNRWFHCMFPVVLLGFWLLCGALVALSLVGADVCVAPGSAFLAVLNATGESGPAASGQLGAEYEAAQFYTSPCGTQPPGGAFICLLHSQATASTASGDLAALNATLIALSNRTLANSAAPLIASASQFIADAANTVNATIGETDCPAVYANFLEVGAISGSIGGGMPVHRHDTHAVALLPIHVADHKPVV